MEYSILLLYGNDILFCLTDLHEANVCGTKDLVDRTTTHLTFEEKDALAVYFNL